ncbi:MAG: outer membrane lipoprotein chaperone LolA [Spiribacter sp.]|nr:outer membrane lipoprotein chaperone LolA [Spiribacter sp.]MDR9489914.1 outer membrane lipoprotein chaperone LolA [Spiribacter sp.]
MRWLGARLNLCSMAIALLLSSTVFAEQSDKPSTDPAAVLTHYFDAIDQLAGDFVQTTRDETGAVVEQAQGTFVMARPQRFVWHYKQPWEQWIVSDGQSLWVHDVDLEQVVVRPLDDALGVGAAQLLSGNLEQLREQFNVSAGKHGGVLLQPKDPAWSFQQVNLQFEAGIPALLMIEDGMGQQIEVELNALERNPSLDPEQFEFKPPEGADVIRGS